MSQWTLPRARSLPFEASPALPWRQYVATKAGHNNFSHRLKCYFRLPNLPRRASPRSLSTLAQILSLFAALEPEAISNTTGSSYVHSSSSPATHDSHSHQLFYHRKGNPNCMCFLVLARPARDRPTSISKPSNNYVSASPHLFLHQLSLAIRLHPLLHQWQLFCFLHLVGQTQWW